jgi:3-(3-hydroxy-phenyl)propionate hydroxylase
VFLAGDAAHQQPPFIGQGMCQGLRDVSNLLWKLIRVIKGEAAPALLDTYGQERGTHVRELTGRIKAIGQVICERDPELARLRDERVLAEGGGTARTITRQEIVPPLSCGLIAATPASGTLFPQPLVNTPTGWRLLDAACGIGWRLITDEPSSVPDTDLHLIAIGTGGLAEQDGIVAGWFARHACHHAIIRPDHYVFGTAATEADLQALLAELEGQPH